MEQRGQSAAEALGTYLAPVTLGDYLAINARHAPDAPLFVLDDGGDATGAAITFGEVNARVNQLVHALHAQGIRKGDRIGVLATDRTQYVELVLACAKAGFVYLPLNYRLSPPEVELLLRDAEPRALFVSEEYEGLVDRIRSNVDGIEFVVTFDRSSTGLVEHEPLIAGQPDHDPSVPVQDSDLLAIAYTSGTTGLPKGVLQPQGMFHSMVRTLVVENRCTTRDFRYAAAPLFHVSGISLPLLGVVLGFPVLIMRQFDPKRVLWWLQEGGLTDAFMVPTMISMVLDQPGVEDHDYPRLRTIQYGAAPMPPALLRRAMDVFGCGFIQLFGAGTEGGLQAVLTPEDHERALAGEPHLLESVGRPPFGVDLRICDPDVAELVDVPKGTVGEIVTKSNTVMMGYYRRPDESARVLIDGWFRGGDLARADDEGFLYLAGRAKDMIIRGGENVYPIEIETVLYDYPGVKEVAVIGVPDDRWGEVVVAVVAVEGTPPSEDDLRAYCRTRLAAYKVPVRFEFREILPKNASGKILKRVLREETASVE
jgi:acyl-CoA synthetase (AMP-forming)/AMP-acid ligase II